MTKDSSADTVVAPRRAAGPLPPGEAHTEQTERIAASTPAWAEAAGLLLLPAIPTPPTMHVQFSADDLSVEAFIDLARDAGARLLYSSFTYFEHMTPNADDEELTDLTESARRRLLTVFDSAKVHDGRCYEAQLAFVTQGVLHRWEADQPLWYENLGSEADSILEEAEETAPSRTPETPELTEEEVQRYSAELQQSEEFRAAPSQTERQRIVRNLVGSSTGRRWDVYEQATAAIDTEAAKAFHEIEGQLTTLAGELLTDTRFQESRARARKVRAVAFLKDKSGGFKPPTPLVDLFMDELALLKRNNGSNSTRSLF